MSDERTITFKFDAEGSAPASTMPTAGRAGPRQSPTTQAQAQARAAAHAQATVANVTGQRVSQAAGRTARAGKRPNSAQLAAALAGRTAANPPTRTATPRLTKPRVTPPAATSGAMRQAIASMFPGIAGRVAAQLPPGASRLPARGASRSTPRGRSGLVPSLAAHAAGSAIAGRGARPPTRPPRSTPQSASAAANKAQQQARQNRQRTIQRLAANPVGMARGGAMAGAAGLAARLGPAGLAVGATVGVGALAAGLAARHANKRVNDLARYSPHITRARAINEVNRTRYDIQAARRMGPSLAKWERLKGKVSLNIEQFKDGALMGVVNAPGNMARGFEKLNEGVLDAVDVLVDKLKAMLTDMFPEQIREFLRHFFDELRVAIENSPLAAFMQWFIDFLKKIQAWIDRNDNAQMAAESCLNDLINDLAFFDNPGAQPWRPGDPLGPIGPGPRVGGGWNGPWIGPGAPPIRPGAIPMP